MPHEKIWDSTNTGATPGQRMPDQNALELHWSNYDTGGWFEVVTSRPSVGARTPASDGAAEEYAIKLLQSETLIVSGDDVAVKAIPLRDRLTGTEITRLAEQLAPHLVHAAGEDLNRLGIMLDRDGVNRLIKLTREIAPRVFGRDQW